MMMSILYPYYIYIYIISISIWKSGLKVSKTLFYMTQGYLEKHDVEAIQSTLVIWMHVVLCHLDPLLTFLLF